MYYITKDGFMMLAMGFSGDKAAKFKEAFIMAFNKMEHALFENKRLSLLPIYSERMLSEPTNQIKKKKL
jgi:phage regulator Rha-like protein